MAASAWEYTLGAGALRSAVRKLGPEIRGVTAYNSSSEITHDVHGLWLILAAVGGGVESVAVQRDIEDIYEHGQTMKYTFVRLNKGQYWLYKSVAGADIVYETKNLKIEARRRRRQY